MNRADVMLLAILACRLVISLGGAELPATPAPHVDPSTLQGKVMTGYQAWFRCPGDTANIGWSHWSEDRNGIYPDTIHPDFWPDMTVYGTIRAYPAPGFTDAQAKQSSCYSACDPEVIQLHFEWMREYDIDGAWLQHFVVSLPGQPDAATHPSHTEVIQHVAAAAVNTGRVWALSYDLAGARGTPGEVFDIVVSDWRKMIDSGVATGPRYLRHNGLPVVNIWNYILDDWRPTDPKQINDLIDFFHTPGPYKAFLVSGGNWYWTKYPEEWQACAKRFDAYIPWNIGNSLKNQAGEDVANTTWWEKDKEFFESQGALWIPTIYPGFSWDHLMKTTDPEQSSTRARRGGDFYWEQWIALKKLNVDMVYIAMFDEVDEGTAIYKCTNNPPALYNSKPLDIMPFQTYEGLPSDWYLRLTQAGRRMLRGDIAPTATIPIKP